MYRILIIDDEKWIRLGTASMIEKERLGISAVFFAENAEEGFAAFLEHRPHIVLSDIKMASVDGCTLGEQIYALSPETKIVMISGYSDFSYARRSIAFRAVDYLLKPVDRDLLNTTIEKCVRELRQRRDIERQNETAAFQRLFASKTLSETQDRFLRDMFAAYDCWTLAKIRYHESYDEAALLDTAEKHGDGENAYERFFIVPAEQYCLYVCVFRKTSSADNTFIVQKLQTLFAGFTHLAIAVGHTRSGTENIPDAVTEADLTLEKRTIGAERIMFAAANPFEGKKQPRISDCANEKGQHTANGNHKLRPDLRTAALAAAEASARGDLRQAEKECARIELWLEQHPEVFFAEVKKVFLETAAEIEKQHIKLFNTHGADFSDNAEKGTNALNKLETACNSCFFASGLLAAFRLFCALTAENRMDTTQIRTIVRRCESYIEEHYHEALSLFFLASKFGTGEARLSAAFKKITGRNFTVCLTEERIRQARLLLKAETLSIADIAHRVGYEDEHYFSKVFKKITRLSPRQYQEKQRKDGET